MQSGFFFAIRAEAVGFRGECEDAVFHFVVCLWRGGIAAPAILIGYPRTNLKLFLAFFASFTLQVAALSALRCHALTHKRPFKRKAHKRSTQ